jgi:hypothetical protein
LIGTDFGRKVVLEGAQPLNDDPSSWRLSKIVVTVLELTQEMREARAMSFAKEDEADPEGDTPQLLRRFADTEKAFGVSPDLPALFMSKPQRDALGCPSTHPVLMRRSIPSIFAEEFREFGIVLLISVLALEQVIPVDTSWLKFGSLFVGSILLAALFSVVNIRAKGNR